MTEGINFGVVGLKVHFQDGFPRFTISWKESSFSDEIQKPKKAGKGNVNEPMLEKVKEYMRKRHPQGVKAGELATYVGCTTARAERLLDLLSTGSGFLVYMDDDTKPPKYFISKDEKRA